MIEVKDGFVYKKEKVGLCEVTTLEGMERQIGEELNEQGQRVLFHTIFDRKAGTWKYDPDNQEDIIFNGYVYPLKDGKVILDETHD